MLTGLYQTTPVVLQKWLSFRKEVRQRTDRLDAVGNTTAAIGKGFAIGSAALTALALFGAYMTAAGISSIDISKSTVMAGLFIGGMLTFVFSALSMGAVGRAAMAMINEVRRQFADIPALKAALEVMRKNEGKEMDTWTQADKDTFRAADGTPEYGKCVGNFNQGRYPRNGYTGDCLRLSFRYSLDSYSEKKPSADCWPELPFPVY